MSHLKICFDFACPMSSPLVPQEKRVVKTDKNGLEHVVFEPLDVSEIRKSNGVVSDWSLNVLLSAGINPNFPIRTGLNTRLEGLDVISNASSVVDSILSSESSVSDEK